MLDGGPTSLLPYFDDASAWHYSPLPTPVPALRSPAHADGMGTRSSIAAGPPCESGLFAFLSPSTPELNHIISRSSIPWPTDYRRPASSTTSPKGPSAAAQQLPLPPLSFSALHASDEHLTSDGADPSTLDNGQRRGSSSARVVPEARGGAALPNSLLRRQLSDSVLSTHHHGELHDGPLALDPSSQPPGTASVSAGVQPAAKALRRRSATPIFGFFTRVNPGDTPPCSRSFLHALGRAANGGAGHQQPGALGSPPAAGSSKPGRASFSGFLVLLRERRQAAAEAAAARRHRRLQQHQQAALKTHSAASQGVYMRGTVSEAREAFRDRASDLLRPSTVLDGSDVVRIKGLLLELAFARPDMVAELHRQFFLSPEVITFAVARLHQWGTLAALFGGNDDVGEAGHCSKAMALPDPLAAAKVAGGDSVGGRATRGAAGSGGEAAYGRKQSGGSSSQLTAPPATAAHGAQGSGIGGSLMLAGRRRRRHVLRRLGLLKAPVDLR